MQCDVCARVILSSSRSALGIVRCDKSVLYMVCASDAKSTFRRKHTHTSHNRTDIRKRANVAAINAIWLIVCRERTLAACHRRTERNQPGLYIISACVKRLTTCSSSKCRPSTVTQQTAKHTMAECWRLIWPQQREYVFVANILFDVL